MLPSDLGWCLVIAGLLKRIAFAPLLLAKRLEAHRVAKQSSETSAANNYYAIISNAVSLLEDKSEKARQELYVKARTILANKRRDGRPYTRRERKALEKAIRDVEKDQELQNHIDALRIELRGP